MKKKVIRIFLLVLVILLTSKFDVQALIKEHAKKSLISSLEKEDTQLKNYNIQGTVNGVDGGTREINIEYNKTELILSEKGVITLTLKPKSGTSFYAGDRITVKYAIIENVKNGYHELHNIAIKKNSEENDSSSTVTEDVKQIAFAGVNGYYISRKVTETITLGKDGKTVVEAKCGLLDHSLLSWDKRTVEDTVKIVIPNVYSKESKADDTALKKQKELEATSGLRGFKKSDNLHFISDVKEATAIQITSGMILTRSDVIDQIKYSESKNPEYTSYTKSSVAKVAQTENIVVMEENMSVLCYTHTYHAGKKDFGWGHKNLIAGHEYTIGYTFVYYPQIDELWYRVTYDDNTIGDTADGDKAAELDDDLFKDISDAEDEVTGIMKAVISRIEGEKREIFDEFHDVLSDAGYYTKIKDIDSNDSKEVEQNVAKIVATVANVGMSLSIIIPALLGVKYMISSAEDKADYKKDLVPYFVGALLLFSICTFVKILQTIGNKINEI